MTTGQTPKFCPCGRIPSVLQITEQSGSGGKYAYVSGDCCGEWEIEFKTNYYDIGSLTCWALAMKAWNAAPRDEA